MGNLHYPSQSHGCKDTVYQIACILDKLRRNRVNNFFCRTWPHGGATTGLSEKCGAEVRSWLLMSVCTKFLANRTNGAGDQLVTDGRTDGLCRTWPHGGATKSLSEKCGAEVRSWPLMSVCTKFRTNRTNGAGDQLVTDARTDGHTDGHTDWVQNIVSWQRQLNTTPLRYINNIVQY